MSSITLSLKSPKSKKSPIWAVISDGRGVNIKVYSGISIQTKHWSKANKCVLSANNEAVELNKFLGKFKKSTLGIYLDAKAIGLKVDGVYIRKELKPKDEEWKALDFAWRIVKHVKSNAIVYATADQLVGVGAGQMSRVDSSRIAAQKAKLPLTGAVCASDAFFPFRDGLDEIAKSGIRAVVEPGGSIRDEEVIAAADEHDIALVFTGMRHFRH